MTGRRKARTFERYVAAKLRAVWPAATSGAAEAVDGTPFRIRTVHGACPNIAAEMFEATRAAADANDDRPPVAITRATNGPALVTMLLGDWRNALAAWERERLEQTFQSVIGAESDASLAALLREVGSAPDLGELLGEWPDLSTLLGEPADILRCADGAACRAGYRAKAARPVRVRAQRAAR